MAKMIQVRNVPEKLHRELVRRARAAGLTLTDYIQQLLEHEIARPPAEEVFRRVAAAPRVRLGTTAAALIRQERRGREAS